MYKNSLLLTALLACNIVIPNDVATFAPQEFTLTYTLTPEAMTEDVAVLFDQMRSLIDDGNNNVPNFYDKLIIFIRDVQTAIQSGMNLIGIATTTQQPILTTVEEVIEAEQMIAQEINNPTTQETKSDITNFSNELTVKITLIVNNEEEYQRWKEVTTMLTQLEQLLQDHTLSPDVIANAFEAILQEAVLTNQKNLKGIITLIASSNE